MTAPVEQGTGQPNSTYEGFTKRPVYIRINALTVSLIPPSRKIVDNACGTGAAITQLINQGKLLPDSQIIGFDISPIQIEAARKKFREWGDRIRFEEAPAEHLPLEDNSVDAMTFLNAAHLTDLPTSLSEAERVLKPGGILALNSAYASDLAYPDGSRMTWGVLGALARKIAASKCGLTNLEHPADILKYSSQDIRQMAESAGLVNISIGHLIVRMNRKDLEAIGRYKEFTEGALPGIKYEIARDSLQEAIPFMFERRKTDSILRGWMVMYAFKKAA